MPAVLSRAPSIPSSAPAYSSIGPQPTNSFVPYPPSSTPPPPSPLPNTAPVTQRYYEPYAQPPRTLRYAAEAAAAADASRVANWQSNPAANGISQPLNQLPRTSPTTPVLEPVGVPGAGVVPLNPLAAIPAATAGLQYAGGLATAIPGLFNDRVGGYSRYLLDQAAKNSDAAVDLALGPLSANNPYNPLNPFGKLWDWAPWNKKDTQNSLNPGMNTKGADSSGKLKVIDPPTTPVRFYFGATVRVFRKEQNGSIAFQREVVTENSAVGIPIGFTESVSQWGTHFIEFEFTDLAGGRQVGSAGAYATVDSLIYGSGEFGIPGNYTFSAPTSPKTRPNDTVKPPDLSALEPLPQPEPLFPQRFRPLRPEAPPQESPSPEPLPLPRPSTRPQFPTTPVRDPSIQPNPSPTPNPATDPQAPPEPARNPGEAPLPFTDPNPFTDPFSPFYDPARSPGQNPQTTPGQNPQTTPGQNPQTTPGQRPFPGSSSAPSPNDLAIPEILTQNLPKIEVPTLPKSDMCEDPCIADMHSNLNSQKPELLKYKVFDKCGTDGKPVYKEETLFVPGNQAQFIKMLLDNMADQQGAQCKPITDSCYAAIPESAQLKIMHEYPQLVIQYAEVLANGTLGAPKYSVNIPHYAKSEAETVAALFPRYIKGNRSGVLILSDNSKIIVNTKDEATASSLIVSLSALVLPGALVGAITSLTLRKGRPLNSITIAPKIANYFANGAKDEKPTWRKYL
jgi:hypothetical protein